MANAITFMNSYSANIAKLVEILQTLRTQNDQLAQDPDMVNDYFASPPPPVNVFPPQTVRTDIVAEDVWAAHTAIIQMLFTFDSGDPPQKAALYEMLP